MKHAVASVERLWPIPLLVVAWVVMMLALGQCAPIGSIPEPVPEIVPEVAPEDTLYSVTDETEDQLSSVMQDSIFYSPSYVPKEDIGPYYKLPGRISIPRPE